MRVGNPTRIPLAAIAFLLVAPGAAAADPTPDWSPDAPPPSEFDWIQLTSDEWLKGEFIAMYRDSLEFESDELDVLTLDWEDVARVRTARVMQVRLVGSGTAIGRMEIEGDVVRVDGVDGGEYARGDIVSITGGAPRERNYWSAKLALGATVRSGNTEQVEGNVRLDVRRRTPVNRLTVDAIGNYGETEGAKTVENARASGSWDVFVTDRFFVTAGFAEHFRDPFQNIDRRITAGAGVGWQIVETARIDWSVSGGPAYQETRFVEVEPGEERSATTPALKAGTKLDVEVTGAIDYALDYALLFTNEASGTYSHHFVTGVEIDITSVVDLDVSFVWDRIEDPTPDAGGVLPEQDDYRTVVALSFEF